MRIGDPERDKSEPASHHQKANAAEEARDETVRQASRDRRDQRGRDRPGVRSSPVVVAEWPSRSSK